MKRLASLAIVAAACTSHKGGVSTMPTSEMLGDTVVITTGGQDVEARVIVGPDGPAFATDQGVIIGAANVDEVSVSSHALGLVEGLAIGAGVGVLAGATIGFADGDDPACDDGGHVCSLVGSDTAGEKAVLGGIALGILGGLVGAVLGAIIGQHDVWERDGVAVRF